MIIRANSLTMWIIILAGRAVVLAQPAVPPEFYPYFITRDFIPTVYDDGNTHYYDLSIDENNQPIVVYQDTSAMYLEGITGRRDIVSDTNMTFPGFINLAISPSGDVAITTQTPQFYYRPYWETVGAFYTLGEYQYQNIVFDNRNVPHVAGACLTHPFPLIYRTYDIKNAGWYEEWLPCTDRPASIDSVNGRIYMLTRGLFDWNYYVVYQQLNAWRRVLIPGLKIDMRVSQPVFDSNGRISLLWLDQNQLLILLTYFPGTNIWKKETIRDLTGQSHIQFDLDIDCNNQLALIYSSLSNNTASFYFGRQSGQQWLFTPYFENCFSPSYIDLCFDRKNYPVVLMVMSSPESPSLFILSSNTVDYCPADYDHNSQVDLADFSQITGLWQEDGTSVATLDLNGDGLLDINDLALFSKFWRWSR